MRTDRRGFIGALLALPFVAKVAPERWVWRSKAVPVTVTSSAFAEVGWWDAALGRYVNYRISPGAITARWQAYFDGMAEQMRSQ